jgi:hypothetical protein
MREYLKTDDYMDINKLAAKMKRNRYAYFPDYLAWEKRRRMEYFV